MDWKNDGSGVSHSYIMRKREKRKLIILRKREKNKLLQWKKESKGASAMLIEGARRVGKSHLAQIFAEKEYQSHIYILILLT